MQFFGADSVSDKALELKSIYVFAADFFIDEASQTCDEEVLR